MSENNYTPEDSSTDILRDTLLDNPYTGSDGMLDLISTHIFKGDKDFNKDVFKTNFRDYADRTRGLESSGGKKSQLTNTLSNARGDFQFTPEAFRIGKERIKNLYAMWKPQKENETKKAYEKRMKNYYPSWMNKTDPIDLSKDDQYALFYANTAMQTYNQYNDRVYTSGENKGQLIFKDKQGEPQFGLVNNALKQLGSEEFAVDARKWLFWNTHYRPSRHEYIQTENSDGRIRSFDDTIITSVNRHNLTLERMKEFFG